MSASKIMAEMASDPDLQGVWAGIVEDRAPNKNELDFENAFLSRGEQGELLINIHNKFVLEIERNGIVVAHYPYILKEFAADSHWVDCKWLINIEEINK